jgi:MerR family transcriptional regulator, light-induced transcriptional regulator
MAMDNQPIKTRADVVDKTHPAVGFLVGAALRSLTVSKHDDGPRSREDWIIRLTEAVLSSAGAEYRSVLSAMVANGFSQNTVLHDFVPEASRLLGEKWLRDEVCFVDVTTGVSRLLGLFRARGAFHEGASSPFVNPSHDQSILMVVPRYEQHSLAGVVAADRLRRHGFLVRMAIDLSPERIVELISANRFSFVGVSLASWKSVERTGDFIDYIRSKVEGTPKVVAGGPVVADRAHIEMLTGADFAVRSVGEAIRLFRQATRVSRRCLLAERL